MSEDFPEEPDTEFNTKTYPPDAFGEELGPNARFYKVYRDEATAQDEAMLDSWNKTLDILLIFVRSSPCMHLTNLTLSMPVWSLLSGRNGIYNRELQALAARLPRVYISRAVHTRFGSQWLGDNRRVPSSTRSWSCIRKMLSPAECSPRLLTGIQAGCARQARSSSGSAASRPERRQDDPSAQLLGRQRAVSSLGRWLRNDSYYV